MKSHPTWFGARSGVLALLLVLGACATNVSQTGSYAPAGNEAGGAMPRPRRVLVEDFQVTPQSVRLDSGIGPRLVRTLEGGEPAANEALEVQDAIAMSLLDDIRKMGLPAERGLPGIPARPNDLLVRGEIVRIDEGNRTRRMAIGFGAGKSSVEARVQLYYDLGNGQPRLLETFVGTANSGHKPGMGVGAASAAAGESAAPLAVSGAVGVHGEKAGVAGEGAHLGHRIAYDLGEFFVRQGWVPASSAPARSLM